MVTAEEGGPTATNTTSSYGGGGAGGKFRKKPSRKQPTPYERPSIATPTTNNRASNWLTKLVVDPTSKLIAYGADRFLPSAFRKRLPLPPRLPTQTPDVKNDVIDGIQEEILNNQDNVQQPPDGESRQPVNSSRSNFSEIEQLLKQKMFSRPEIVHLTELLQSRVAEDSMVNECQKDEDNSSVFGRIEQYASGLLEENRNEGMVSPAITSTPLPNSNVLEDGMASPAELAKAYMGSRPSKVSPSALRARRQVSVEDAGLLSNRQFASKSPIMSLVSKTSIGQAAPEYDFRTPRSRGRSAIYNMARTPYSRFRSTSILKGSRIESDDNARPSITSSSALSLVENGEKFPSRSLTLKRRSSDIDDELGSVGPIRRIRQKSNLLATRIHHTSRGVGSGSLARQKLQLIDKSAHKVSVGETDNESVPSNNYARVPSKSSEVAARILQHLENLTPKEKSPESKLTRAKEKSPMKSVRITEGIAPLKLMDGHESGNMLNAPLPDPHNSSLQKPSMVAENGNSISSDTWNSLTKNDYVAPFRHSRSSNSTDPVVENGASVSQKKSAFKMSAQEDFLEMDDDVRHNELPSAIETSTPANSSVFNFPALEASKATEPVLITTSATKFDKPKEASSLPSAGRFPALPVVSNVESSKSLVNISASAASEGKTPQLDNVGPLNHVAGSDSAKGPFSSHPSGGAFQLTTSTSVSNLTPAGTTANTSSNASASIFGLAVKPSNSVGGAFFKFGSSVDPATSVTTESTSTIFEIPKQRAELELNPWSGSSNSSHLSVTMAAATTAGGSSFGLGSFSGHSTLNNLQSSFTGKATKSLVSDNGTSLVATSVPSAAPASSLSFGINSNTSGSSSSSLGTTTAVPVSEPTSVSFKFGASPAISSEANIGSASSGGATPGVLGFGLSSSSASTNPSASSGATTLKFGFGGTSSVAASLTSASPFSSVTSGTFSFGVHSSTSSSTVNLVNSNSTTNPSSQSPKPSTFGSNFTLPSTGFSSGAPSSSSTALAISPSTSTGFPFGAASSSSAAAISPSTSTEFSFGISASSSAPAVSPSTGFPFGASAASAPAVSSSTGFPFGASAASAAAAVSPTMGFPFRGPASSSAPVVSPSKVFSFGASSSSATAVSPSAGFSFGATSSSSAAATFGLPSSASAGAPATGFSFGAQSTMSAPTASSLSFGASTPFGSATSVFPFGASSTAANASPVMFNSSASASPNPFFSAAKPSTPVFPSSPLPNSQPVFGSTPVGGFTGSPGNNDQMMAEDQVQLSAPSTATFGQPPMTPSPSPFAFGSAPPSQPNNPFMFGGQQNQAAAPNPSPFQASGSGAQFNAGGSFSLGSGGGGGDKSGRKIVKPSRTKNRRR